MPNDYVGQTADFTVIDDEPVVLTVEDIRRACESMSQYVVHEPRTFIYHDTIMVSPSRLAGREEGKTVGTEMLF